MTRTRSRLVWSCGIVLSVACVALSYEREHLVPPHATEPPEAGTSSWVEAYIVRYDPLLALLAPAAILTLCWLMARKR